MDTQGFQQEENRLVGRYSKGYKRAVIIGDVHGCKLELEELLETVKYHPKKDRLIFVGDLINKGPDSLGVLELVLSLQAEVVTGNHELGFLQYLKTASFSCPGFETLKSQMGKKRAFWKNWMTQLPAFIRTEQFTVVHGGKVPNQPFSQTPIQLLTTIRTWDGKGKDLDNPDDPAWFDLYQDKELIVFGHWAKRGLVQKKNAIGLDTGCVFGKKLTALTLPDRKIFQVSAKQSYEPIL